MCIYIYIYIPLSRSAPDAPPAPQGAAPNSRGTRLDSAGRRASARPSSYTYDSGILNRESGRILN